MSPHPSRSLLIATAVLTLALSGCGGGGGDESSSSAQGSIPATATTAEATTNATGQAKEESKPRQASTRGKGEPRRPSKSSSHPSGSASQHIAVKLPALSSAAVEGSKAPAPGVKVAKGGDNSVQAYGVESSDSAREEAALALQAYLDARLEEDWGRACSYLFAGLKGQLEQASLPGQGKEASGCAGAMGALSKGRSRAALREGAKIVEVLSFRIEGDVPGDPSFLLYLGLPDQTLYSMPMYFEGGGWKVGLVQASELPV